MHVLPAVGRVVEDDYQGSWEDVVMVQWMTPLEDQEADRALWGRNPPIRPIIDVEGANGRSRGAVYRLGTSKGTPANAGGLLELKMVEVPHARKTKNCDSTVWQLDEELGLEDLEPMRLRARALPDGAQTVLGAQWATGFDFEGIEEAMGIGAHLFPPGERLGEHDHRVWQSMLGQAEEAAAEGLRVVLHAISDGSVLGEGYEANSTCGWLVYACTIGDCRNGVQNVLGGCSVVDGPPEDTSSTRAEAQGLLTMFMALVKMGWEWDLDLRLDNSSVVNRKISVHTEESKEVEGILELEEALRMADPDIWTEFEAWRGEYVRHCGAAVVVQGHPGHPELKISKDGEGWTDRDWAIYRADQHAEVAHKLRAGRRAPRIWSHKPEWQLRWGGLWRRPTRYQDRVHCCAQRPHRQRDRHGASQGALRVVYLRSDLRAC